jgi:DNA-binding FrmR family transcriptional regulator
MAHTIEEKQKLLNRVRRLKGQLNAVEHAMYALMAEVIEGHIRMHVIDPKGRVTVEQHRAADDLVHALRAYLK